MGLFPSGHVTALRCLLFLVLLAPLGLLACGSQTEDSARAQPQISLPTFPGAVEQLQADVIGNGDGIIAGRTLTGSAHMQLVVSTVPGVDTGFAFVPRMVGARIASTSAAEIAPDGSIVIVIENHPAEGDSYQPTRTRLTGTRLVDVAAPPPE